MPKKVDVMMHLEEPKTHKQLRGFIGMINYCRDMWRHRSHAPLTRLTSTNIPWKWGTEQSEAFKEAKKILSEEALLAFPVFDKTFATHSTDASHHRQLGAVISQDNHPAAFCSRKLNEAQTPCTTAERELLSTVVNRVARMRLTMRCNLLTLL
jgi:hypothetical protein